MTKAEARQAAWEFLSAYRERIGTSSLLGDEEIARVMGDFGAAAGRPADDPLREVVLEPLQQYTAEYRGKVPYHTAGVHAEPAEDSGEEEARQWRERELHNRLPRDTVELDNWLAAYTADLRRQRDALHRNYKQVLDERNEVKEVTDELERRLAEDCCGDAHMELDALRNLLGAIGVATVETAPHEITYKNTRAEAAEHALAQAKEAHAQQIDSWKKEERLWREREHSLLADIQSYGAGAEKILEENIALRTALRDAIAEAEVEMAATKLTSTRSDTEKLVLIGRMETRVQMWRAALGKP